MLVDSHCHLDQLDLVPFQGRLDNALLAARQAGVEHFLCVCIDMNNFPAVLAIAERYDDITASVGNHPNEQQAEDPSVEKLVALASHEKVVAIGETGLDYFRSDGNLDWQRDRFRRHIQAAKQVNKPLIVHTRNAGKDTIRLLREEKADEIGGVLHCFTDDLDIAQQAIDLNFYISFSGIITFKNAQALQQVARSIPLERVLIETDCPYLAPVPYRGKPNQPAYVRYVAESLAELRETDFAIIAEVTTQNFYQLFHSRRDK